MIAVTLLILRYIKRVEFFNCVRSVELIFSEIPHRRFTETTMVGEEKRHQMMQNLFGDQSEEEEEEEVESEHESNRQPDYASV